MFKWWLSNLSYGAVLSWKILWMSKTREECVLPTILKFKTIEQSFGLCGRGRGWDDLGEWHWNMYNFIYETSRQSRFDAQYWMLGADALRWPRGMTRGGRREGGSRWETRVYLWWIHVDIWQNQYNIVKLKRKIKLKKIKIKEWKSNWRIS